MHTVCSKKSKKQKCKAYSWQKKMCTVQFESINEFQAGLRGWGKAGYLFPIVIITTIILMGFSAAKASCWSVNVSWRHRHPRCSGQYQPDASSSRKIRSMGNKSINQCFIQQSITKLSRFLCWPFVLCPKMLKPQSPTLINIDQINPPSPSLSSSMSNVGQREMPDGDRW